MRIRRLHLALAAASMTVAAAAIATPAVAATSAAPARSHVTVAFTADAGIDGAVWFLKPTSALHDPVQHGNASGGIRIQALVPGRYVLQVQEITAEVAGNYASKTFTVTSGQTLDLGTLKPTHQPLTLSGTGPKGGQVTDAFGWSTVGDTVKVSANGRYSIGGLMPGTYTVTAQKEGYADKRYTVAVHEPVKNVTVGTKLR